MQTLLQIISTQHCRLVLDLPGHVDFETICLLSHLLFVHIMHDACCTDRCAHRVFDIHPENRITTRHTQSIRDLTVLRNQRLIASFAESMEP